ncbi:MAG: hypothetical protein H6621_04745 [Halobacteriovoraceae bacterium]|nr:hypothetical protein [Halobacteriovoraceae bacterium]
MKLNQNKDLQNIYRTKKLSENPTQFIALIKKLNHFWRTGDYPGFLGNKINCEGFQWDGELATREALKCAPQLFQCFLQKQSFTVLHSFEEKQNAIVVALSFPDYEEKIINLEFQKNCHETYLPKGLYGHGQEKIWKNDKNIFIDKFLVENSNATTLKAMKKYCADQGKKLLTDKIFDAMTFYRNPEEDSSILYTRFPWGYREEDPFITEEALEDDPIQRSFCQRSFVRECLEFDKLKKFSTDSVSWMGVFQVFGGDIEVVATGEGNEYNANSSSQYFARNSYWQRLGTRFKWDGLGFSLSHYTFQDSQSGKMREEIPGKFSKIPAKFRCYKEIP